MNEQAEEQFDQERCLSKARDINREIRKAEYKWLEAVEHAKACKKLFESYQAQLSHYLMSLDMPLFDTKPSSSDQNAEEGTQEPQGEDLSEKTTDLPRQPENAAEGEPAALEAKPKKGGWPKGKPRGPQKPELRIPFPAARGTRIEHPHARAADEDKVPF
jgi:hypothetical protein